ncbi:uncharacterized protein LOC126648014 isoform X1 [Myiozetetes cayanensis]|uniref:uncharacterized protein LOC126648014 isoform X1 n=1 Tax=Myiozetetes cayanensis TaxID=478635 RepID=UPI00216094DC|nr:uncharacterized protein LOC126648014 isoform X1 [Myiozetetes cayanensis]
MNTTATTLGCSGCCATSPSTCAPWVTTPSVTSRRGPPGASSGASGAACAEFPGRSEPGTRRWSGPTPTWTPPTSRTASPSEGGPQNTPKYPKNPYLDPPNIENSVAI